MKISSKIGFSHEKFFVKLLSKSVKDQEDFDKELIIGDRLLPVEEYHRLLDENERILSSILDGKEIKDAYLYEFNAPVEISEFYDQHGNVIYQAWNYDPSHHQPDYRYGRKFGDKYEL